MSPQVESLEIRDCPSLNDSALAENDTSEQINLFRPAIPSTMKFVMLFTSYVTALTVLGIGRPIRGFFLRTAP